MPSYAQLELEPYWRNEIEAPAHAAFNARMRAAYGLGPGAIGSKGDNDHLYGRHRSRNWDLNSRYCTDRNYATQDQRDRANSGDLLRASDIGISGPTHWAAAHRLDAAVRAGRLPCVAEWFGTFDGKTVVGWYEGHPSSSDDSHLFHLHVGLWTASCDDAAQLKVLGDTIVGAAAPRGDDVTAVRLQGFPGAPTWADGRLHVSDNSPQGYHVVQAGAWSDNVWPGATTLNLGTNPKWDYATAVVQVFGPGNPNTGGGSTTVTPADITAIAEAVVDEQHDRLAE